MLSARTEYFLDSNVLIYAAAGKLAEPRKYAIAYELVASADFGVSGQLLAEFCSVVTKKKLLVDDELDEWLLQLERLPFVPVDRALVNSGVLFSRRHRISYYDAAMLAAAERLGATIFYSEDLNHNQVYGPVRVVNPFLES
jgi:predicted nucleic acid-binding protein